MAALTANADDLVRRAGGTPIRIATKSVRVRGLLEWALARPGFQGLMAYALPEAIWLVRNGATDVLVAYPTVDRDSLADLRADPALASAITVMVDDPEQLRLIASAPGAGQVRVCLDIDASLRLARSHLGVRRSPVHSVSQAVNAARAIVAEPATRLVGLMFYDAQIAGMPDTGADVRAMKAASARELRHRRPRIVEAVSRLSTLDIVNAGGTGSIDVVADDPCLTEVAAGSGLFGPTLFDDYRDFTPQPAFAYALPVTRRPAPDIRTLFGGGYMASGEVSSTRQPTPVWPEGLRVLPREGVGEVQTPITGTAAAALRVGDRVWWRHPKAGEVCERFASVHLVDVADDGEGSVASVPTYRGEGRCFG
ncbi:MAG: alanine racemase [Actinomycetota bacterium]|nr:alanine racemase [Actinomycetota bacterium]